MTDDQSQPDQARRRLVFDNSFCRSSVCCGVDAAGTSVHLLSRAIRRSDGRGQFLASLPFAFTVAQERVFAEIEADLQRSQPMARLVQGDVGSGKTVVAIAALLSTISSGWQGALMAPTEVLAEQHHRNLCRWLPPLHVTVELLTGATPRRKRRQLLDALANGSLTVLVGTHALLEDPVVFSDWDWWWMSSTASAHQRDCSTKVCSPICRR